jgi:hypothetical protein
MAISWWPFLQTLFSLGPQQVIAKTTPLCPISFYKAAIYLLLSLHKIFGETIPGKGLNVPIGPQRNSSTKATTIRVFFLHDRLTTTTQEIPQKSII